jgi:hypothetical protein
MTLSLLKLCTRQLHLTCLKRLSLTQTPPPRILHMILKRRLTLILVLDSFSFFAFVGAYRVCFFLLSFCFRSPPASHLESMYMEGTSLTTHFATRLLRFMKSASLK